MLKEGVILGERYEIISRIGSGGMADVYRAKDHRLNRYVAVKILKNEYSEDAKFVTKFRQEAQAIACLSHPNIVGVYDAARPSRQASCWQCSANCIRKENGRFRPFFFCAKTGF